MRRVAILSALFVLLIAAVGPAYAAPKGDARDSDVGKKLWNFNVIATPNGDWAEDDSVCSNNGSRMFFEEDTIGTIRWSLYPNANQDFKITDCDGTSDGTGAVAANESLRFWVMVKLVGPKTSELNLVCQDVIDEGVDDLCVVGSVNLSRNATTKIMHNIVDNEYEEVLWTLSGDWKIFQVLVYEKL